MEIVQSGHSSHIGGMHAIVEDSTKASSPILLHSETHQQTGDIKREGSKLSQTSNNSLQDWLREQTHSIGGARERGDSGETEEITDYSLDDSKMASINDRDSLKLAITCHDKGSKIEEDGRFEKAIEYHEKGLEIRIKVLGRNHFDTAISCARIASVHSKMGESGYDQALNYYHQALPVFLNGHYSDIDADADTFEITNGLQVRESTHSSSSSASNQSAAGINIHSAAGIYANIGSIHYRRGEYKYALEHYSMALSKLNQEISPKRTKNKSKFDKVKIDIAAVLNTIGTIHSKEIEIDGNGKEAISRYKQSLKIRETVLGKKHPETLATYNNIGSVHFNLSNVDSALKYFKRALPRTVGSRRGTVKAGRRLLDRQRSIFDKVDYDYAISKTYSNIGSVHFKKGNFERSLHYYSEALRLQYIEDEDSTSKSIDKQLSAATTYSNIASAYSKKGDFEDSLEFHVRALEIRETQLGDHVDTATSYYNIGFLHARHEDYDLALEAHRKSLDIRKNVLGENHKDVASSYNSVGISYFHLGYYTEAITSHLRAIKVEETVLGTTHSTTGMSYNNVGTAYYKNREHDLALQYYMKALLIKQEAIGPNHRDMYSLYSNIGATYWRKGDKDQAAIWFQKACNVNKERFEKDHYLSSNKFLDHISDSRERKREVEKGQPLRDAWSTGGNESNSGHSKKISENDVYTDGDVGGGIIVDLVDFPVSLEMGASTGDDVSVSSFQEDEMVSNSEELSSTFGGKNGEADIEDGSKTPKRSNTRTLRESATVLSTDNVADDFNDDAIKDSDMPDGLAKMLLAPVAAGAMLAKKVLNMNGDQCVSSDANDNADAINEDLVSSRAGADGSDMESEVENDLGPEEEGEEYVETFHEPETATDFLDDKGASSLDQDQAEDQYDKVNAALVALAVTAGMAGALLSSSLKDSEEDAEHAVSASQHEGTMVDTAMIARDSFSPRKPSSATNSAATALPVYDGDFEILGMQQDADQDSDADINVTSSGLIASVKMHVVRSDKKGVVSRHSSMNHSFVEREGSEEANDFWMEEKEFVETSNKLEIATYILGVKDATADMDKPVVGSEEVEEGHDFRREEENNVPRFDQNEYIGFSGETSDFDALVTLGSDVLPEGNNSEPLSVSTKESLDDNGALRFDQNEYIGFSGETSDFDALVTLGSDGLPEASRDIDHDDKSSRVVNNSMRFDPIDYLGDSGDTSDYDALISVGSNGFPVTKSVRPKRASKFGKMSAKDAARLSHMGEANGLDASEDNASISSFHQYSAKYEELSETFAHLYQGDTVKRRRSKNASRGLHANESARAAYAKISRNAGIPSHRIRNDGRHLYGRDQNSNMHSSNNVPSRHRHGRDSKSSSYSHYAARKLDRSPSGRWRRKVANLTRQSLPSSQSTTAISVYDKLYQLSRLSGPGRTLKRSYMPNKSRFQRLYGYDRQKSHEYTRRRKHRMLPSIFMKLYEMSLQRQIEGKNRRLKIERELQMREAERRGDFARGHTPESGSLRLHRNRANQSRSNLQEELVKPKQKITIGEATELYNRLLYHKNQTKKKVEEVRKLRELRESEWQRSQRKEKIMLARLHSLYNRNTVASELRAENR